MKHLSLRLISTALFAFLVIPASAQVIVGMGDSVGAGVQSNDLKALMQVGSYIKLIARQAGDPMPLPLVAGGPFTSVSSVEGRSRINPAVNSRNLSFSGAEIQTLLNDVADLTIDNEQDLMFAPRIGNMVDLAEDIDSDLIFCWLGNNDVLGTLVSFDQLDASQLTPEATFETVFTELAERLGALDANVVYGNVPSLDGAAFALDNEELTAFTGTNYNLPLGHLTTFPTATLLRFGLVDASVLDDPNYVLDPTERAVIQTRTDAFNQIIAEQAAANGAVVADMAGLFDDLSENGYEVIGLTVTSGWLGGLTSLDAVHPSNITQAIIANRFIETANSAYGTGIPKLSNAQLALIAFFDPYIDKDGDGRVTGRWLNGLLETLGAIAGVCRRLERLGSRRPAAHGRDRRGVRAGIEQVRRGAQGSRSEPAAGSGAGVRESIPDPLSKMGFASWLRT